MPKGNRYISPKLKLAATDFYYQANGRYSVEDVAQKFDVPASSLYRWLRMEKCRYPDFKKPKGHYNKSQIRYKCEHDLLFLAREILGYKRTKDNFEGICDPPDLVHREMADWFKRPERFKLGIWSRETYKTTIIPVCGSIQCLLKNPNETILIASEPWDKARDILKEIKRHLIYNETLIDLYGEFLPKRDPKIGSLWNSDSISIAQRKSINLKEWSIDTTGVVDADVTGKHPRVIFIDDPVIPRNITTFEQKQKVINFIVRCIHKAGPRGLIFIDGTPYDFDDAYAYIQKEWIDQIDPSTGSQLFCSKIMGIEDNEGKSIMPSKFTPPYIQMLKNKLPLNEFACQYACNPKAGGNTLVKPEDYEWLEQTAYHTLPELKDPDWMGYMAIDPGASLQPQKCYTGIIVGIPDSPYDLYIDLAKRIKAEPSIVLDEVVKILQHPLYRDRIRKISVETASFQKIYKGSLHNALRKAGIYGIEIAPLQPNDSKHRRLYSTEPYFRHHQIHVRVGSKDFLYQVGHYPHLADNNLDLLDALEMLIRSLPPSFMVNPTGIIPISDAVARPIEQPVIKDELHGYAGVGNEMYAYQDVEAW